MSGFYTGMRQWEEAKGLRRLDMKTAVINAFLGLAALMLAACGTPEKATDRSTSAGVTKPAAAAETADALLALDNQANAAYLRSDSKFFEGMLSDKFVMREGGRQMDKAAVVKLIASNKCNVKGWRLEARRPADGQDRCGHLRA
jgi:hypothetical protein